MRLKTLTSLLLSASLVLSTSFGNIMSVSAENNLSSNNAWKTQYKQILEDFMNSEEFRLSDDSIVMGSRFDLLDVTHDGIPELFISPDSSHAASCNIYSFNGSCVENLGKYGSYGEMYFNKHYGLLCSWNSGQGISQIAFFRYIPEDKVQCVVFYDDYGACPPESTPTFTINYENVSEEIYRKSLDKYSNSMYTVGRNYSFSNEDIQKALS